MALYNWFLTNPFGVGPKTIDVIYLGHTGGGVYNLDGEPTWPSPDDGTIARFIIQGGVASLWQLIASVHADDPANGWKRPLDYEATQNAKVWHLVQVTGTGGGAGPTQELVDVTMQDAVPAYVMVTADGRRADSSNSAHFGKVVGMTTQAYSIGAVASLVDDDEVTNTGWAWSPGAKLFLNGTNVSTTPPSTGWSQMIGVARSANTVIIQLRPPILL